MIVMYTSSGSQSCRKAKQYMKDNGLSYVERNIMHDRLSEDEIRYLLERSTNGTDEIISERSKTIREAHVDIEEMHLNELISFVRRHPDVLKRPIILDHQALLSGYDDEEISIFKRNSKNVQEAAS